MRDIDFEELDKAVGSYLENGVVPNSKEENNEVFSKIENQIEHSREQQKMVFARKAPQSANQLHYNNGKKQIRNIKIKKMRRKSFPESQKFAFWMILVRQLRQNIIEVILACHFQQKKKKLPSKVQFWKLMVVKS